MKKNNLLQSAIVVLLVASPLISFAGQYPAADFEPKILYQDESVKSAPASGTKVVPAKVASAAIPVATAVSAATVDDSKYPAANFEPKVLFKDDAYKPVKSTPSPEYTTSAGSVIMEEASKEEDNSLLLILGALVAVGFAASRCPKFAGVFGGNLASNESSAPTETGVARYLNARIPKVSGVTKYLERAGKPTNVARYIAKQNLAQKAATQNDANRG